MLPIVLALLLQGAPAAPPAPPNEIKDPDWRPVDSSVSPMRFYPEAAQKRGVTGSATIACSVTAVGTLTDCVIVSETPPAYGFGAAALRMSVLFRMRLLSKTGQRVEGGRVTIPIRFALPR